MRILNIVIAKTWGGGEQYVYDVCKQMNKRGIQCFVLVDRTNIKMQMKYGEVANVLTANLYTLGGLFSINEIKKLVLKNKIDLVNCHSGHALLTCLLVKQMTDIKVVMFKHNALPSKKDIYHRWQMSSVDAFVCVSQLVYDLQTRELPTIYKDKFHLVYNGIDTLRFENHSLKSIKEPNQYTIGYAGRLAENKGISILLQAFCNVAKLYPQTRLLIAGPDEKGYISVLERFVIENHLTKQVKFLGLVNDMEKFYKSLNLFVLPSTVKESFGLVICEALYCGVPVIATDSGAQREIITDCIYGSVVPSGDVEKLEIAIKKYLEAFHYDDELQKRKDYVSKHFNIAICVDRLLGIYASILP